MEHRFGKNDLTWEKEYEWETTHFTGEILCHPERLSIPLRRRKPTVYAVWNDLYHESVDDHFVAATHGVAAVCPQHTLLFLTKRASRALNWHTKFKTTNYAHWCANEASQRGLLLDGKRVGHKYEWPINNIYLGLTVCNQQEADEKIPIFLQVPGKKFLSIEPVLGEIDINKESDLRPMDCSAEWLEYIDAVILGGETGPGARPMHPDWVRSVRDQCAAAGVPFFFKGWGEWVPWGGRDCEYMYQFNCDEMDKRFQSATLAPYIIYRVGRKKAGRRLDGRTHDELPWVKEGERWGLRR
jgi:protein gp37